MEGGGVGEAAKHRESCLSPFSSVALSGLTEPVGATGGAGLAPPTQPAVDMLQRNPPRVGVVGVCTESGSGAQAVGWARYRLLRGPQPTAAAWSYLVYDGGVRRRLNIAKFFSLSTVGT